MGYLPSIEELLALDGFVPPPDPRMPSSMPPPMMPPIPQPVPEVPTQLPQQGGGFGERFGLALAQNPVQYQRRRGASGLEDFFGNLIQGAANTYGQGQARQVGERETFNAAQRQAAIERNKRNLEATTAGKKLAMERWNKVREAADKEKADIRAEGRKQTNELALIRARAAAKVSDSAGDDDSVSMTGPAIDMAARRYLMDGTLPTLGMGKKSAGTRVRIIERAAEIDPNADIAGNAADFAADRSSLMALQKMSDNANAFAATAHKNSQVLLDAMAKITDTGSAVLNKPLRDIDRKALGSAETAAYETALRTVIPEFARLLNNPNMTGVLSDAARKEIEDMANGGYSLNQMKKTIATLELDAANRTGSYRDQIAQIRNRRTSRTGGNQNTNDPLGIRGGSANDPLGIR